jgi:hypothetical protein
MWKIQADMIHQWYDLPEWVGGPRIAAITCRIGTRTSHIRDGKLNLPRNSLQSEFLIMISPIPSDLSLSRSQLDYHLRTLTEVIALNLSMP